MIAFQAKLPISNLILRGFQSNPDAPHKILALHGWLDNCFSFKPLSALLSEYNIIAIDLPGHGDSQTLPPGIGFDFHYYLVWLHELVEVMQLKNINLMGHSMGAVIASLYAGIFAERLQTLVLIEGLGPSNIPESESPKHMKIYIESWHKLSHMRNSLYRSWPEAIAARQKSGNLKEESAKILAERGAKEAQGGIIWKHDPRLKIPSRYQFSESQILAYLKQISCSTLLIEATDSPFSNYDGMGGRTQAIKALKHVRLKGNHHLHLEDPGPSAAAIKSFFENSLKA